MYICDFSARICCCFSFISMLETQYFENLLFKKYFYHIAPVIFIMLAFYGCNRIYIDETGSFAQISVMVLRH